MNREAKKAKYKVTVGYFQLNLCEDWNDLTYRDISSCMKFSHSLCQTPQLMLSPLVSFSKYKFPLNKIKAHLVKHGALKLEEAQVEMKCCFPVASSFLANSQGHSKKKFTSPSKLQHWFNQHLKMWSQPHIPHLDNWVLWLYMAIYSYSPTIHSTHSRFWNVTWSVSSP